MSADRFGKVAVLMGGLSAEREVSLNSGKAVLEALRRKHVDAQGIDADHEVLNTLATGGFDRVFIALHGRGGEDGAIQGALEVLGLPYTGSGVLASALGMDKLRSKRLWAGAGIMVPEYIELRRDRDLQDVARWLGFPVFVKPVREGSSLGMSKVYDVAALDRAWREAARYDRRVLVERCIDGPEYTVAFLGDEPLPLIKVETPQEFYDYQAKYLLETTSYICPCGLDHESERRLQEIAARAYELVGCHGWGRVDFMVDRQGTPYVLELNTVPGLTDHSLVPMAAKHAGIGFDEMIYRILESSDVER